MECPKCKKQSLKLLPWLGMMYQCYNSECNYRGPIVLEKIRYKEKIRI